MNTRRVLSGFALCLCLVALLYAGKQVLDPEIDLSEFDFRDGDIVLQHLSGKLGTVICSVTGSQMSHCGMVVYRQGEPQVIEAIGPVRYISLQKWLKQGDRRRFTQMRLKEVSKEQIAETITVAEGMLGRPYDIQYELDDEKIYCSELVYKAYLRGAKISVGEKQKLGDLNWQPHEAFIRQITGGDVPLEREMVSPVSVARSPKLKLLYSTFPADEDEPSYDQSVLAGKWSGEYTFRNHMPATATVEFDAHGKFSSGAIRLHDGQEIAIRDLPVEPFKSKREFSAQLQDARGIACELNAKIRDEGKRVIGNWKDNQGNRGIFSFEKNSDESQ